MSLPELYAEGLAQRALLGQDQLNIYKLGLIEAILKETLRGAERDPEAMAVAVRTALDVARWEMRQPRRVQTQPDDGP